MRLVSCQWSLVSDQWLVVELQRSLVGYRSPESAQGDWSSALSLSSAVHARPVCSSSVQVRCPGGRGLVFASSASSARHPHGKVGGGPRQYAAGAPPPPNRRPHLRTFVRNSGKNTGTSVVFRAGGAQAPCGRCGGRVGGSARPAGGSSRRSGAVRTPFRPWTRVTGEFSPCFGGGGGCKSGCGRATRPPLTQRPEP